MNIVVLAGGTSTEREVSINTGERVCAALRSKGHNAIIADVFFGFDDIDVFNKSDKYDLKAEVNKIKLLSDKVDTVKKERKEYFGENVIGICKKADIVFLALHGENGENGKLQAAFDLHGIKYTGSDYLGCAMAMDKGVSKKIFLSTGIPTAKSVLLTKDEYDNSKRPADIGIPCVVKTCCGGSSVGVYIVNTEEEYETALKNAFEYEDEVLIEEYIKGREFSVGVIDGKALPVIEIVVNEGFYDYKNKYLPGAATEICPAQIDERLAKKMQHYAEEAFKALKLSVYGRIDFLLDNENEMYALEANNLPGMTATSLLPQEAGEIGIDYPSLCEKIIELSLQKEGRPE